MKKTVEQLEAYRIARQELQNTLVVMRKKTARSIMIYGIWILWRRVELFLKMEDFLRTQKN